MSLGASEYLTMLRLLRPMLAFVVAVGVNTASVAVEHRWHVLTRLCGRAGWYLHLAVIAPAYLWLFVLLASLDHYGRWKLPAAARPLGAVLMLLSAWLWKSAYHRLGGPRVANGDVFGRVPAAHVKVGVFLWLRDPMYDSYALALVGAGLWTGNIAYFALAAESIALLNCIEAKVEARALRTAISAGTRFG